MASEERCKYCEISEVLEGGDIDDLNKSLIENKEIIMGSEYTESIYILPTVDKGYELNFDRFFESSRGVKENVVKINFCPMCGRDLNNGRR